MEWDCRRVILRGDSQRDHAKNLIERAPADCVVEISPPTRSTAQNRKLWAALKDISAQVLWDGERLTDDEWKDFLTAVLRRERGERVKFVRAPGLGLVLVGMRTSRMSVEECNDLLSLIDAFGTQQGVRWSEPDPDETVTAA